MSDMLDQAANAIIYAGYNPATAHDIARIVIKAMREPTDEMVAAGWADDPRDAWYCMIDEALK